MNVEDVDFVELIKFLRDSEYTLLDSITWFIFKPVYRPKLVNDYQKVSDVLDVLLNQNIIEINKSIDKWKFVDEDNWRDTKFYYKHITE